MPLRQSAEQVGLIVFKAHEIRQMSGVDAQNRDVVCARELRAPHHRAGSADSDQNVAVLMEVIVGQNAIRLEIPDAVQQKNEQNGCLRFDRTTDDGTAAQTDLYLLTEHSFHHIVLRFPEEEKETYYSYIEYMINTMETNETDLG